jgi:23S rRNA (uracil1939-C5)-methyltransferase
MSRRPAPRRPQPNRRAPSKTAVPADIFGVTVARLGSSGDGVASSPVGTLYIADSLPGETLTARPTARRGDGYSAERVALLSAPSPDRVPPPCPQATKCGGCSVQHLTPTAYATWKQAQITTALRQAGLPDSAVRPLATPPPGTRRRATLAAERRGRMVALGFHGRRSDSIAALDGCLVLHPRLLAILPALQSVLGVVLADRQRADIFITLSESGLDIALHGLPSLDLAAREELGAWAQAADLARLSWVGPHGAEPVALRRSPLLSFGGVSVRLPAGAFTQASAEAEAVLVAAVREAVGPASAIADLFSGLGTFSLPLAQTAARVLAVEGDSQAVAALTEAARAVGLAQKLTVRHRDLFQLPLLASELAGLDAVLFDPPRAGAKAQAGALATSAVPTVVAVSCNPATFARDAALLVGGGYRLEWVQPIDQFHWTGHVELVARFGR